MQNILMDSHGRVMKKLRVSLLDACNFRCIYCMPEDAKFTTPKDRLSAPELGKIIKNLVSLGIDEIRLTGGEPTLSPDFINLIREIHNLNLEKLAITTNGLNIAKFYPELKNLGVKSINFSLDTLDEKKFEYISKVNGFKKVIDAILLAKEYEFDIKINCVLMKNINHTEVNNFVQFSKEHNIPIRFLETMNIGVVKPHFERWFISASEIIENLKKSYQLEKLDDPLDSTSFNFKLSNGAQIGFIASESQPFCSGCSRLRLDALGNIHPCLFKNEGISLKGVSLEDYPNLMPTLIARKPMNRIRQQDTPMYQLGG